LILFYISDEFCGVLSENEQNMDFCFTKCQLVENSVLVIFPTGKPVSIWTVLCQNLETKEQWLSLELQIKRDRITFRKLYSKLDIRGLGEGRVKV
jgi:hypothetical protein